MEKSCLGMKYVDLQVTDFSACYFLPRPSKRLQSISSLLTA